MHTSVYNESQRLLDAHLPTDRSLTVLELGSRVVANQKINHRSLFDETRCSYIGLDIVDGENVDIVMDEPYRIPVATESVDVAVCGQVFEHVPFFWISFLELARVLRPDGFLLLSAPSRGHVHSPPFDGWRFHHQGFEALGSFAGLRVVEATTDYPPTHPESKRFDYTGIAADRYTHEYWGDTVALYQKTLRYDESRIGPLREQLVSWGNFCARTPLDRRTPTSNHVVGSHDPDPAADVGPQQTERGSNASLSSRMKRHLPTSVRVRLSRAKRWMLRIGDS